MCLRFEVLGLVLGVVVVVAGAVWGAGVAASLAD